MSATPPQDPGHDAERDAHLQVALRHAPDAELTPPPALSDAILRAAHGAVAPARARETIRAKAGDPWLRWFAAAWTALGQPRYAGAVAGLMVATLAGVLWWGQPIQPGLDVAPPVEVRSNDSAPRQAAEAPAKAQEMAAARLEPTGAPKRADVDAGAVLGTGRGATSVDPATRSAKGGPATGNADLRDEIKKSDAGARIDSTTAPARREAVAQAPPAPAAESERQAAAAGQVGVAQDRDASSAGAATAPAPAPSVERRDALEMNRLRSDPASARAKAALQLAPTAAPESLARLRQAMAAEPERWTWRLDVQPPRAVTMELLAWLAQLDAAAGATLERAAPQALPASGATTLHLIRDAQLHSSLSWSESALQLTSAATAQVSRRAGPSPQSVRELDAALAQIATR